MKSITTLLPAAALALAIALPLGIAGGAKSVSASELAGTGVDLSTVVEKGGTKFLSQVSSGKGNSAVKGGGNGKQEARGTHK